LGSVTTAMVSSSLCVARRSGPLEAAFQVPHAGEVVERASRDLARPVERVGTSGRVIGAARTGRVPGPAAAGLGRALVEVLTVPRRRERAQVPAQPRSQQRDARGGDTRLRLWVALVGGQREGDREPLL